MTNELVSKNLLSGDFDVADLSLHRDVARLIKLGGAWFMFTLLIELGCRRMVRTEIDDLVRQLCLLAMPPEGEA